MTCGVYTLEAPSGKVYVGSSANIEKRVRHHEWSGRHKRFDRSAKLYRAYAKHGALRCSVLLICRREDLLLYEQACINAIRPELNSSALASRVEMTAEVRAKIGSALSRRVAIACEQCGGVFRVKPCHRDRRFCSVPCAGAACLGRRRPPEVGAAITAAKKGRGNGLAGRVKSEATRTAISESLRGRSHSPERREAIRVGMARAAARRTDRGLESAH